MTIHELENQLEKIKINWKSWPKSIDNPLWPEYREAQKRAFWIMAEIEKIKNTPKYDIR